MDRISKEYAERLDYIIKLTARHALKVSADNAFYDWSLFNPVTMKAKSELVHTVKLFLQEKITEPVYLAGLYAYFQLIFDETLVHWNQHRQEQRVAYATAHPELVSVPLDVKLSARELAFINERWRAWEYRDTGQAYIDDDLNNDIGEIIYPDVVVPRLVIKSDETIIGFGKYGPYGELGKHRPYKIKDLYEVDPQYLIWSFNNIPKFNLSEELKIEIHKWAARFENRREANAENKRRNNRKPY